MCNRLLVDIPIENLNLNRLDLNRTCKKGVFKTYNDPFIVFCNEFENCVFLFQKYLDLKNESETRDKRKSVGNENNELAVNVDTDKKLNKFISSITAKYINSGVTINQVIRMLHLRTNYSDNVRDNIIEEDGKLTIILESENRTVTLHISYENGKETLEVFGDENKENYEGYKDIVKFIKEYISFYFFFTGLGESQFSKVIVNYSPIFYALQEEEKILINIMMNKFVIDYSNKGCNNKNGFNTFLLYEYIMFNYKVFKTVIEKVHLKLDEFLGKTFTQDDVLYATSSDKLFSCIKNINYDPDRELYKQIRLKVSVVGKSAVNNELTTFNLPLLRYTCADLNTNVHLTTYESLLLNRNVFSHIGELNDNDHKSVVCDPSKLRSVFHTFLEGYHYADRFQIDRFEQIIKLLLMSYYGDDFSTLDHVTDLELYSIEKIFLETFLLQKETSVSDFIVNNHLNEHRLSINDFIEIYIKQSCQNRKFVKDFKLACENLGRYIWNSESVKIEEPDNIFVKSQYDKDGKEEILKDTEIKNEDLRMLYF